VFEVQTDNWPLLLAENDQCYFSITQILLVADIFMGTKKKLESSDFSLLNQISIFKLVPANVSCKSHFVAQ